MFDSGMRPTLMTCSPSTTRSPVGRTRLPAPLPPSALAHAGFDLEGTRVHPIVLDELDLDRTEERVALVAGVLTRGVAQLAQQGVVDLGEVLVVLLAQRDGEVVRDDRAASHVDRTVVVHLPDEPPAELDGPQAATETPARKAPFDHALETALEPRQTHGATLYAGLVSWPTCHSGEWRNWQTRRIQVPVSERTWGFKSPLAHRLTHSLTQATRSTR